ncbi:HNH endonuclease [Yasminevirus sp. GU-2018]|uniref:HNH endonuclease n=1 Tax=Yasminevirus sp. GU-2018 TaxID=2420051 RepID=A0A5K0U833_9VIRU|nr:HNH endonuclease [Yasminevirus sp. GU-2018]
MSRSVKVRKRDQNAEEYPTDWIGGIPRGSIQTKPNFYRVVMSIPGQDKISKPFYWDVPVNNKHKVDPDQVGDDQEEALELAKQYRMRESNRFGITRNRWRKIDAETIEVRINDDTSFYTDLKHSDKVEMYPVFAKKAHKKLHVISQDKKRQFPFHTLIKPNIKLVEYIDGDPLNLREANLREFGAVEIAQKVLLKVETDDSYDFTLDHYALTKFTELPYVLPKNVWILGKPAGTVFERGNVIHARVMTNEKYGSRTFKFDDTTRDLQYENARKWQYETSYKFGVTKNLIKILDNKHILVQITKDLVIKTNIEMIHLIQQIPICASNSGNPGSKPYAVVSVTMTTIKFHNLITQNKMTDHIDGDTLNNTLENLRSCDYSINNSNRHFEEEKVGYEKLDNNNKKCIFAKIKVEGRVFEKYFYFKTTHPDAIHAERERLFMNAYLYRQFVLYGKWDDRLKPYLKHSDFVIISKHFNRLIAHQREAISSKDDYFTGITDQTGVDVPYTVKALMYRIYYKTQIAQLDNYTTSIAELSEMMFENLKKGKGGVPLNVRNLLTASQLIELKTTVQKKGGVILTPEHSISRKSVIDIKCSCGYNFNMSVQDVMANKFCYACHDNTLEGLTKKILEDLTDKPFEKVRPEWLKNTRGNQMEIDMYNDELKLGVEYNGRQHVEVINMLMPTEEKLQDRIENDKLKIRLCRVNGVTLISVPHTCDEETKIREFLTMKLEELGFETK